MDGCAGCAKPSPSIAVADGATIVSDALAQLQATLQQEREGLLTCVHCGFCLPACPTYRRLGDEADSPRGRLHLMRAVAEGRLDAASEAFEQHIDRCLGCRACEPVCPSGVPYGRLLEQARQVVHEGDGVPVLNRAFTELFARSDLRRPFIWLARVMRRLGVAARLARLPSLALVQRAAGMLAATTPANLRQMAASAAAPTPVVELERPPMSHRPNAAPSGTPVLCLEGCVQADLFSHVNEATRQVLHRNGYRVDPWPGAGCCGALHAHSGDLTRARTLARTNIAAWQRAGSPPICVNAAGCGAAMKEYGHLLADDPAWAHQAWEFSAQVADVSELLAQKGPCRGGAMPMRVAWDPPCHLLHAQGVDAPVRQVLQAIPELEVVDVPDGAECCGGAGIYALTHADLGSAIGHDKASAILQTQCEVVATANPGCTMQIGAELRRAGSRLEVVHPVELLAESYRRLERAQAGT